MAPQQSQTRPDSEKGINGILLGPPGSGKGTQVFVLLVFKTFSFHILLNIRFTSILFIPIKSRSAYYWHTLATCNHKINFLLFCSKLLLIPLANFLLFSIRWERLLLPIPEPSPFRFWYICNDILIKSLFILFVNSILLLTLSV